MPKKRKKRKSERQRNFEGYQKALQILSKHSDKRLLRSRYYGCDNNNCEISCGIGILGTKLGFSEILKQNILDKIECFPALDLQKITQHIPLAVLVEIQMENDFLSESEMNSSQRYSNLICFLNQKVKYLLDSTKVTATA